MDNRILVFLVTIGALLLAITVGAGIASSELLVPAISLVVLLGIAMLALPETTAFCTVGLFASGLTAPGLPGQFGLFYVFMAALIGCAILSVVFKRAPDFSMTPSHWLLAGFCVVVLLTGLKRGMGFQFLGSSLWGGFFYIQILMSALLVFALPLVNMPASWWPRAIVIMGLLAPLPLLADTLVLHGVGFGVVRSFLQTGANLASSVAEQESGQDGVGRLTTAGTAVQPMLIALLAIVHTRRLFQLRSWWALVALVLIFVLSLLSGFRMITAGLAVILFAVAFLQGTFTLPRVLILWVLSVIAILVLYQTVTLLPYSVQRSLSWLPGIHVASISSEDATGTITWRLDLWREAIHSIPEYFWLGKGFSYSGKLLESAQSGYADFDPINWALVSGAYHNGYLSLLLITGIFGFLTGLPLLITVSIRHIRLNRTPWKSDRLRQCHQVFLVVQVFQVLTYLTVYGDVTAIFPPFLFYWAILEAIRKCDLELTSRETVASDQDVEEPAYTE